METRDRLAASADRGGCWTWDWMDKRAQLRFEWVGNENTRGARSIIANSGRRHILTTFSVDLGIVIGVPTRILTWVSYPSHPAYETSLIVNAT